jgi:fibronectin type III domain protein
MTLLFGLCGAASAAEVETHLFNATLSLTGDCSTSGLDLVPDPSCPYEVAPNGPSERFKTPRAVATDAYGNIYLSSASNFESGLIDIFDPTGKFITEKSEPGFSPRSIAVDSEGRMYVFRLGAGESEIVRYDPTEYKPDEGKIAYGTPPIVLVPNGLPTNIAIAIDRSSDPAHKDHLFVPFPGQVNEYGSGAEGNPLIPGAIGTGNLDWDTSVTVSPLTNEIYVSDTSSSSPSSSSVVRVFSGAPGHSLIRTITGAVASPGPACPPGGHFSSTGGFLSLAVDAKTNNLMVLDAQAASVKAVFEFNEAGTECISKTERSFAYALGNQIAIDNGANSPNGGLNPFGRYLYVPSGSSQNNSHLWAFEPKQVVETPEVKGLAASEVTATDAKLSATVNPRSGGTHYTIEYTPKASFNEGEVVVAKEGDLPAELADILVSTSVTGLKAGTKYHFRVKAENSCETDPNPCTDEAEATFTTYTPQPPFPPCENDPLRLELGSSALLSDCRAYELVTPPDTGGRALFDVQHAAGGDYFGSNTVSTEGNGLAFITRSGSLPGTEGAGGFAGTSYLSLRNEWGWGTDPIGPSGSQSAAPLPGGMSPDLSYSDTRVNGERSGSLVLEGKTTGYIRHPDGSFHLLGEGSEETDPDPNANYLAPNGAHTIYTSSRHLEEQSPAIGVNGVYDRTANGVNQIASRLPGEAVPGVGATYLGSSYDGSAVAFGIGAVNYVRRDDTETLDGFAQAHSGHQLSCGVGTHLAGATPSYEWLLDGTPIGGANASTYTPLPSQAGSLIQCVVAAANVEGGSVAASEGLLVDEAHAGGPAPRPPANGLPSLAKEPAVGQTLQCQTGVWGADPFFSYQWLRNGSPIGGATNSSYEVQPADHRTLLQCLVSAQANGASAIGLTKSVEVDSVKPPTSTGDPVISNLSHPGKAPVLGDQLSCSEGSWANAPTISYQWLRNGAPIATQTTSTHTIVVADQGTALQCEVGAVTADGTAKAVSGAQEVAPLHEEAPSGSLQIAGNFVTGATLECQPGTWSNSPTFAYQWLRNGAPIETATNSTYALTASDRETVVECELTATGAKATVVAFRGGYVNEKPEPTALSGATTTFAGLSADGGFAFYLSGGDLFRFDTETEATDQITTTGDATVVNVPASGDAVFFVSPSALTGGEENPVGDVAQPGEENLYRWSEGGISFVASLSERDVAGEKQGGFQIDGLGLWTPSLAEGKLGLDPSRASQSGEALLFESRNDLTKQSPGSVAQVYRYDAAEEALACISCDPRETLASADASLQTVAVKEGDPEPLSVFALVPNLSQDGQRAFFQTSEALLPRDTDGVQDVYEWEAAGQGSCSSSGGCIYLISSGRSSRENYLFGLSASGNDAFIWTTDKLLRRDATSAPSIYDARINGGFPEPKEEEPCEGEGCRPNLSPPIAAPPRQSGPAEEVEEPAPKKKCPKSKKRVKRHGKYVCVAKHHKHKHRKHHKSGRAGK